ncbi:trimeric intracellular cation channel family protein [Marinibacterium sp. SX1]|uniref:trimeric intracellular cation channel family protein n=1 Tax=Marinibacterium sp. SX1 TaxID=3388424 RepID=UPI003D16C243
MWFSVFDIIGTVAFAYSGFVAGARRRLDLLGVVIVAYLTASAGGALSQVLLGEVPRILTDELAAGLILGTVIVGLVLHWTGIRRVERRWTFVAADAIGLAAFALTGASLALGHGLGMFGTTLLAFLTAVGGGLLRDSLIGDVPVVLRSGFYGIIAVLVGLAVFACDRLALAPDVAPVVIFAGAVVLRLIAHARDWSLPVLTGHED